MAEKQDSPQVEFFTQSLDNGQYEPRVSKSSFFLTIRGYEKALLLIIVFVLTSIVSFSIGVDNGRRMVLAEDTSVGPDNYTIQVVALRNRGQALAQAQFLAKEGMAPMIFVKGKYIILCVGKFSNPESAQPLLMQLQKTYAGCRIRRL